uniref:Uncharacterized protein n=1 Tax=Fusarium oxysporum (strain Fo5176) TaxID=660025 RepID=A0A0D2XZ18_FUSOF
MSSGSVQGKNYSPELNLILLGILTLTARFHPDLVRSGPAKDSHGYSHG